MICPRHTPAVLNVVRDFGCLLFLLVISSHLAQAQTPPGFTPFGSYTEGPDVIDLAKLDARVTIPVFHKPGRGLDFEFDLTYDTTVWSLAGAIGNQSWQPAINWGWSGSDVKTGHVTRTLFRTDGPFFCATHKTKTTFWYSWSYTDGWNVVHKFAGSSRVITDQCNGNSDTSLIETLPDGTGYTIDVTGSTLNKLTSVDGNSIQSSSVTDRNGNRISNSGVAFTDTLGALALTIAGTAPDPVTYSYTAPSGAAASYTVRYTTYTVQTNYGCPGVVEYGANGTTTASLVSEIDLPDSSKYVFDYEATPAFPGKITGRLNSITFPTGGKISYAYSGGGTGVNGITCADGTPAILARTISDGAAWSGNWNYARVRGTLIASTTTVTDPFGNATVMQFQGSYETQRQNYQGSPTGTLLQTRNTCYNGATSPCTTTAVTPPINSITALDQLGSSGPICKHVHTYDAFGMRTEADDYNYGPVSPGALLRKIIVTYAPLATIHAFKQTIQVQNGTGQVVAQTTNNYDETAVTANLAATPQHSVVTSSRGNLTSVSQLVQGTTNLIQHFTYFDTGTVKTSVDVNGATMTYSYPDATSTCGNAFATSAAVPLGLSQSFVWNCNGGVLSQTVDENGKSSYINYTDPQFWRASSTVDAIGAQTNFTYSGPNSFRSELTFNSGSSTSDVLTTLDGLGRVRLEQTRQAPGSSNYDSVQTDYDSFGRPSRVTIPSPRAAGQISVSGPATSTTYDVLSRPSQISDAGTGSTSYTYPQNDILVTVGPAPAGENTKRRQLEYDGLGRVTSVCEITGVTGSGICAQSNMQTGFWTKYTYNPFGKLLSVTQNAQALAANQQSRSYNYDGLDRLTSETNPESGTTTYKYDSDTSCGNYSGDLVKKVDAVGNITCRTYDALHRPLTTTYTGPYAANTPNKHLVYDGAFVNSVNMLNTKTRLAEAYTTSQTGTVLTDIGFSYSARGELADVYEATPHSGVYYHSISQFWENGQPKLLSNNIVSLPAMTYSVDGEGRPFQVTASAGQNPVTNTTYNSASLPTIVTFGSADNDTFAYDPSTNRMTQYKYNVNSQAFIGALTWNPNGTLTTQNITDPFNSADAQNCSYSHDDLVRIASVNCGAAIWQQNFGYDAFGNITKTVPTGGTGNSFQPTYSSTTNRFTSIAGFTPTYDADGNVTNDSNHSYSWDADGNSITVDGVGLTFDALDRVVEQNRSGVYTQIVYTPLGEKFALLTGATLQKGFISLPGQAQALYTPSGLNHYSHSDWLGSARLASSPTRTVLGTMAYAPFGETYAVFGTPDRSFTGKNQDTVTGDYDFPYREYSNQGRWPSPDPAGLDAVDPDFPDSWNRYAYVQNHALSFIDPLGLDSCVLAADGTIKCDVSAIFLTEGGNLFGFGSGWVHKNVRHMRARPTFFQKFGHALACAAGAPLILNSLTSGEGATTSSVGLTTGVTYGTFLNGRDRNWTESFNGDSWGNLSLTWTNGHDINGKWAAGLGWSAGITSGGSKGTVHDLNGPGKAFWGGVGPVSAQVQFPFGTGGSLAYGYGAGAQYAGYNQTDTRTNAQTNCLYVTAAGVYDLFRILSY